MTDKIQQARRAAFEAKCPVPAWVTWNVGRADYYSNFRDSTRKRQAENYSAKWNGFNSALDAVEIELPKALEMPDEDDCEDYEVFEAYEALTCSANTMLSDCRRAIESTNLGIKVK